MSYFDSSELLLDDTKDVSENQVVEAEEQRIEEDEESVSIDASGDAFVFSSACKSFASLYLSRKINLFQLTKN